MNRTICIFWSLFSTVSLLNVSVLLSEGTHCSQHADMLHRSTQLTTRTSVLWQHTWKPLEQRTCVLCSSREIQRNFNTMKGYSTELTRQTIWSFQKSFCPSFCWAWGRSYFPCFLAQGPSHLLTSGSLLNGVCSPEYLLGNKSEGSLDPTKHRVVSILYPQIPSSHTDQGLSTCCLFWFPSAWLLRSPLSNDLIHLPESIVICPERSVQTIWKE